MKFIYATTLFVVVFPHLLAGAEPSAFGAGDLTDPNPYGLTQNEKVILETKKKLHKVQVKSNNQADAVESLRERLDGFQSIIEGIGKKSYKNKVAIAQLKVQNAKEVKNANEYDQRLSDIVQHNSEEIQKLIPQIEANKKNIEKMHVVVSELSKLIEGMNSTLVTREELSAVVHDFNEFKSLIGKELIKKSSTVSNLDKMKNADIDSQAVKYFEHKKYDKALEYYTHLIKNNYRPAHSNYIVGEIKYRRKNYADAISYFKKSASLYSKASYMPALMLHTAISMHRTRDYANAKKFYNAIISKYPNSVESQEAFKRLSSMK